MPASLANELSFGTFMDPAECTLSLDDFLGHDSGFPTTPYVPYPGMEWAAAFVTPPSSPRLVPSSPSSISSDGSLVPTPCTPRIVDYGVAGIVDPEDYLPEAPPMCVTTLCPVRYPAYDTPRQFLHGTLGLEQASLAVAGAPFRSSARASDGALGQQKQAHPDRHAVPATSAVHS